MKKTLSIIALCMIITLCIPSVPCYAASHDYVVYLTSSGGNYTGDLQTVANALYYGGSSIDNSSNSIVNTTTFLESLNLSDYIVISHDGGFDGSGRNQYTNALVSFSGVTDCKVFCVQLNGGAVKHLLVVSSTPFQATYQDLNLYNYSVASSNTVSSGSVTGSSTLYCVLLNYYNGYFNQTMPDGITNNLNNNNMVNIHQSNNACFLRFSSLPVYSIFENSAIGLSGNDNTYFHFNNYVSHLFDDFDYTCINETVNALTLDGVQNGYNTEVIVPDVVYESNSNHMYFNNCDFGFCEPKGISNYNQFGGAYIYCRYVVDDWVVNHISDYSLQISMETLLDNQRYFRTLNYPLDRDGCLTLPFKNFGLTGRDDVTQGFVVVGNTNQTIDTDYYKVNLYSITTEQSKAEWFENAARTYNSVKAIDIYDTYDFSDVEDFYESNVAKYNKFTINLRAVLVSGEDNSGPVARSFNLVTGADIATDTTGFDNENPFVPDDSSEDYTPSLPSDTNTTVPSIIVNTGGTWQGTFNGKIGYDPGYTDLKLDVNKDPDGNFTQYLNPMKNQTFGSWFFSFLDDMPGEMKALLIAGTGVGIFFGLYRFIRRG